MTFPAFSHIPHILLCCLMLESTGLRAAVPATIIEGSVKFPANIKQIPVIRIYCGGRKIPYNLCDIDNTSKQFKFQIPKSQYQRQFNILITDPANLRFVQVESKDLEFQNTIEHIQLIPGRKYRYYLARLEEDIPTNSQDEYAMLMNVAQGKQKLNYKWTIQEQKIISRDGNIPDETVIVCYGAHCVNGLVSLNTSELPTIELKEDLLKLVGSEKKLREFSDKFVIASLDTDTIHSTIRQDNNIRREPKRTIIAPQVT